MASNEDIFDAFLRHQVQIQKLTNGQASRILKELNGTNKEMALALFESISLVKGTKLLSRARSRQYTALMNRIKAVRKKGLDSGFEKYVDELAQLIEHELAFSQNTVDKYMPVAISYKVPNAATIAASLLEYGVYNGYSVMEWFDGIAEADAKRIFHTIKSGVIQGLSTEGIIGSVIGSSNMGYKNGVQHQTHNSLRNMVRTVTAGITADARNQWILSNRDIIAYEVYTAVLDGRTTLTCASLDGQKFDVGTGPMPPLHINCRSVRVPVVDLLSKKGVIGERPYVRDTRTGKKQRVDFRVAAKEKVGKKEWSSLSVKQRRNLITKEKEIWQADAIGQVDANVTFQDWFARQPSSFQRSYLGSTRYKAYKEGEPISAFVAPTGDRYTIEELKRMEII